MVFFFFLHEFLLNSTFHDWYDWLCRSFLILHCLLASGWVMLGVSKILTVNTISCVGCTVIYLSVIYF